MKSKADKHREAGTLGAFRLRQQASRAGTAGYQERLAKRRDELPSPFHAIRQAIAHGPDAAAYLSDWVEGDVSSWPLRC